MFPSIVGENIALYPWEAHWLRGKDLEVGQPEMNHGLAISLLQDLGKVRQAFCISVFPFENRGTRGTYILRWRYSMKWADDPRECLISAVQSVRPWTHISFSRPYWCLDHMSLSPSHLHVCCSPQVSLPRALLAAWGCFSCTCPLLASWAAELMITPSPGSHWLVPDGSGV